jgi:hypothetical protein
MQYLLPYNSELKTPYRAKQPLQDKVAYIFNHPTVPRPQRNLFKDISTKGSKGLINDMSTVAIGVTIYYMENPQQFGHAFENIHFAIIRRMWLKMFHHIHMQQDTRTKEEEWKYLGITLKMLAVNNGLLDELIRVVTEEDYYKTSDDVPRKRKKRISSGVKHFEYLCSLE